MAKRHFKSSAIKTIVTFFLLGTAVSACADLPEIGGTTWKEEALQHDGSKIVVIRSVERGGRHEIGQDPPIKKQRLIFNLVSTSEKVMWEDGYSDYLGSANFNLRMLEIVKGTPYVLASPAGCSSYDVWGRPNPPYVIFRYRDKEWKRVPLQQLPEEIKLPNLISSSPDTEVKKTGTRYISAELVGRINEGYTQPQYRSILREGLPKGNGCKISTTATGKPIAPEVNGEIIYYNWWPLATEWLEHNYGQSR